MSQENKISAEISEALIADVTEKLNSINASLNGVLIFNLTADERIAVRSIGDKSLAFVEKSLDYASGNPSLVPIYLDIPEAKKDFELSRNLYGILQQVNTLQRSLEDTMMVAGSEAYDAALIFYNSVKGASRVNVPGSEAVYNDLQKRFSLKTKRLGKV